MHALFWLPLFNGNISQIYRCSPVMGASRILPPYSPWIIKDDKKGWKEGSGKSSSVFASVKRQGEGEVKVSLNPK